MLATALEELDQRPFRDVILWVLPANHAALAFYSLPIRSVAREALLLEEVEPDWGRWQVRAGYLLRTNRAR